MRRVVAISSVIAALALVTLAAITTTRFLTEQSDQRQARTLVDQACAELGRYSVLGASRTTSISMTRLVARAATLDDRWLPMAQALMAAVEYNEEFNEQLPDSELDRRYESEFGRSVVATYYAGSQFVYGVCGRPMPEDS